MKIAQTEIKSRKIGWLLVFVALSLVLMTVWSREPDTGVLHRTRVATQAVAAPVSRVGMWVTSPFRNFFTWMGDIGVSRGQVVELQKQNKELRTRVVELEEARLQDERLAALEKNATLLGYEGVEATVIGLPPNNWTQVLTVDKGTAHGIDIGMPVVGPNGLLGQVTEVGPGYSRVRLTTDQRSGVASLIQRSRASGIAKGTLEGSIMLDFISIESTLTAGDVIVTSGKGGIYPKGLIVGEVLEVSKETNSLYKRVRVTPANTVNSVESVMILTNTAPATDTLSPVKESGGPKK